MIVQIVSFLRAEIFQKWVAFRLLLCMFLVPTIAVLGNYDDLRIMLGLTGDCFAEDIYLYLSQTGFFMPLSITVAALNASAGFCIDINHKRSSILLLRTSSAAYLWSRFLICALLSFTCLFVPGVLSLCVLMHQLPGSDFFFSLIIIWDYSIFCSFWCLCGLFLSVFFTDYYISILSPLVLCYCIGRLSYNTLPAWYNINNYMQSYLFVYLDTNSRLIVGELSTVICLTLSGVLGNSFVFFAKRKLEYEV